MSEDLLKFSRFNCIPLFPIPKILFYFSTDLWKTGVVIFDLEFHFRRKNI